MTTVQLTRARTIHVQQRQIAYWINLCTCVPDAAEVLADPHKLSRRHADDGLVLGIRDAKVLAIDVHELHLEVGNLILLCSFPQ